MTEWEFVPGQFFHICGGGGLGRGVGVMVALAEDVPRYF